MDIYLTEPQERFVFSEARHPGMVAGYGAGKSQAAAMRILMLAFKYPGMNFAFVEPTFDLVRLIAWPRFTSLLDEWGVGYELNKSTSILEVENGSTIIFRSGDNPERLVGFEVADAVIDEADTMRKEQAAEVWVKMIGRARQRKPDGMQNTVGAVSTPEGFSWFYETFGKERHEGYELITAPTWSNPYLPPTYLESLKASYSEQQLLAYSQGIFTNLTSGTVYADYDRYLHDSSEDIRQGDSLMVGVDFNVLNMSAVVLVLRADAIHAVRCHLGLRDTPTLAAFLRQTYPNHQITIYPDASGGASKSLNASLSDLTILRQHGFMVLSNPSNPAVRDRVASVNAAFRNGKLFVNSHYCAELVASLEQQAYDKNGAPDKTTGHDHANDAFGYCVSYRLPIARGPVKLAQVVGL